MARSVVLLLAGAFAGGAAVWLLAGPSGRETPPVAVPYAAPELPAATSSVTGTGTGAIPPGSFASARLAAYTQAAGIGDRDTLEASIRDIAAEPAARIRDMKLAALLSRLAEIDPAASVRLARNLYLETRLLEPLFEAWALADPDAAIDGVAVMQPPARQRKLALAVLRALGNDADDFEQVAAALPASDRASFEIDALVDRAGADPVGVLQLLTGRERGLMQTIALQQVLRRATETNPLATLAQIARMEDYALRAGLASQALSVWAESDPAAVFDWIESADVAELPESTAVYQALAKLDQGRLLAAIDNFPPAARASALQGVVLSAADDDPAAAAAMLDTLLRPGRERDMLLQTVGRRWGERDPEAALAWARGLSPPSQTALTTVLQGVALTDFDRAIDLIVSELDASPQSGPAAGVSALLPLLLTISNGGTGDMARLFDRLADSTDPRVSSMLAPGMSRWASAEPELALNWALANAERIDASAFSQIAQQMTQSNVELAVSTLGRLAPEQRAAWLEGVAGQLAQIDVNRAQSLLSQYRGQPGFENAYASVITQLARRDPPAAAMMLRDAPATSPANGRLSSAAGQIAREWARRDPAQAANWAQELTDQGMRDRSMSTIAQTWAQGDTDAARNWLFSMAPGDARDAALDGYVTAMSQFGDFDAALIDAYSSDEAGDRGAARAIMQISRSDPAEAERMLDVYIKDPDLRRQTGEQIERMNGANIGNVIISNGIVFR